LKRAILKLTDNVLMDFLSNTVTKDVCFTHVENGLPPDVKIIRTGYDECGVLNLVLESENFEDVVNGDNYPILTPPMFIKVPKKCQK